MYILHVLAEFYKVLPTNREIIAERFAQIDSTAGFSYTAHPRILPRRKNFRGHLIRVGVRTIRNFIDPRGKPMSEVETICLLVTDFVIV